MSGAALPQELLDIIVCPDCHGALAAASTTLTCTHCGLVYPIRDQIPVLLVDEATRPTS